MSMNVDSEISFTVAPRQFIRAGFLISVGRDGLAYQTAVNHKEPWWAKGPLYRLWARRQPQIIGFATNHAQPGGRVWVATKGSMVWPDYPRGK